MKRDLIIAAAVLFGGLYAGTASAQYANQSSGTNTQNRTANSSSSTTSTVKTSTSSDQTFAKNAAEGGMAEVKLGQLAEDKGSNQAVKDFGKRMVNDHSKADDQLKQVASKDNINLPIDVSAKDKATYDRLSKLSGTQFDRAYARDMVSDHSKDVAEFQREAKNGKNDDIKNFASSTLPTLQDHLKMARDMESQVSPSTGKTQGANNQTRTSGS